MSAEENKAVIRQFIEGGLSKHRFDTIATLLDPAYTNLHARRSQSLDEGRRQGGI